MRHYAALSWATNFLCWIMMSLSWAAGVDPWTVLLIGIGFAILPRVMWIAARLEQMEKKDDGRQE